MAVFSLRGRFPEIVVAMENVAVVDGKHFIPRDLNDALFYDGAANFLDQSPVDDSAVQSDRKGQPRSPGDYNVVLAEVRKPRG